jgi:hypothetical protein
MSAALDEAPQIGLGPARLANAAEGLAVPEKDVAAEQGRRPPLQRLRPRLLGVGVSPERVVGKAQAVTCPRVQLRGDRAAQDSRECLARARGVAGPQRRPAARVQGPHAPLQARAILGDLTEEPVRFGEATDPIVGLAQPVARLSQDLALGAGARRALQRLGGLLVLALLEARAAAFERLRRHAHPGPDAGQRARRQNGRDRLVAGRHADSGRWQRRQVAGRGRERHVGEDGWLVDRRGHERHERGEVRRGRLVRARSCGDQTQPHHDESEDASHDLLPEDLSPDGLAGGSERF